MVIKKAILFFTIITICNFFGLSTETYLSIYQIEDSLGNNRIIINKEVIGAFKKIWNEENKPLSYDEYINLDTIVGQSDFELIRSTIINYIQKTDTVNDTLGLMDLIHRDIQIIREESPRPEVKQDDLALNNMDNKIITENIIEKDIETKTEKPVIDNKTIQIKPSKKKKVTNDNVITSNNTYIEYIPTSIKFDSGLVFNVQVAASKTILNLNKISERYRGALPIFITPEETWYKYRIGNFYSYKQAHQLKSECNVNDAFIIAYKDGNKLGIAEFKKAIKNNSIENEKNLFYKVQIAASKKILSKEIINNIYNGDIPINIVIENGWYKYQIGTYMNYNEANLTKQNSGVDKAFIVAYLNGNKINIKKAIELTEAKKKVSSDMIIFKIQIAADKKKLSKEKLNAIYNGKLKVSESFEDGWYKYLVGKYTSYSIILENKKTFKVPGCFVVAYKNGRRINIQDAINCQ